MPWPGGRDGWTSDLRRAELATSLPDVHRERGPGPRAPGRGAGRLQPRAVRRTGGPAAGCGRACSGALPRRSRAARAGRPPTSAVLVRRRARTHPPRALVLPAPSRARLRLRRVLHPGVPHPRGPHRGRARGPARGRRRAGARARPLRPRPRPGGDAGGPAHGPAVQLHRARTGPVRDPRREPGGPGAGGDRGGDLLPGQRHLHRVGRARRGPPARAGDPPRRRPAPVRSRVPR